MTVSHKIKQLFQIRPTSAFTIVELLIVIVIIGILAAITVVAYNGITGRARVAALQSAATQAATKIELLKDSNGNYPTTVSSTDLPPPPNITYDYQPVASKGTYCLTATDPATGSYFVTSTGTKSVGPCPVAYFPLDGTAEDKSAYQNNGTNNGATATADRNGKAGGAMGFDGNGQIISGPKAGATAPLTITAWIYPVSYPPSGLLSTIVRGISGTGHYMSMNETGTIRSYYYGTTPEGYHTSNRIVELNKWSNVITIWDGTVTKFYVNGELTNTVSATGTGVNSTGIQIGSEGSTRQFFGKIDDVNVYSKVLSDKEIKQLYEAN